MGLDYPKMCVLVAVFVGLAIPAAGYSYEISRPIYSHLTDSHPADHNDNVTAKSKYADCSSNFTTLERVLFETGENHYRILTAFYPPRESVALYADIYYTFLPNETDNDTLVRHWIWTSGSFYLIQPPAVFRFTSLFFSYPEGHIHNLSIVLPGECRNLTPPRSISGDDGLGMLEVLTHRLKLYAEYNSLDQIVTGSYIDINRFLGKAVPDNHQLHHIYQEGSIHRGRYEIIIFFVFTLALPFLTIAFLVVIAKGSRVHIRNKITDPKWHPTIASSTAIGFLFTAFVLGMDLCALIWAYPSGDNHHNEFSDNHHSRHYVAFVAVTVIFVIDTLAFLYTWVCGSLCLVAACCDIGCPNSCLGLRKCCTYCWFPCCFCGLFCGRNVSKTPQETLMWWLLTTAIGPMMCFSSHIGYMVLGWIIYPKRGGAVFIIYVLSFFYYFMMFKQIYLAAAKKDFGWRDWGKIYCGKLCYECKLCSCENADIELAELAVSTPEKELEDHDSRYDDDDTSEHHLSFLAFFFVVLSGIFLGGLEALSIAAFTELPLIGVIEDTPMYMLNLFHVTVLVASIVLTYKYLTAEAPIERELLKGIIQNLKYYRNTTPSDRNPTQQQQQQQQKRRPRQITEVERAAAVIAAIGYNAIPKQAEPPDEQETNVTIENLLFLKA